MADAGIEFRQVSKRYGDAHAPLVSSGLIRKVVVKIAA